VEAQEIGLEVSGSGSVKLGGESKELNIEISGSGKVWAFENKTQKAKIEISGSGEVETTVSTEIVSDISGSGKVRYKGNPQKEVTKSSGSGKTIKVN